MAEWRIMQQSEDFSTRQSTATTEQVIKTNELNATHAYAYTLLAADTKINIGDTLRLYAPDFDALADNQDDGMGWSIVVNTGDNTTSLDAAGGRSEDYLTSEELFVIGRGGRKTPSQGAILQAAVVTGGVQKGDYIDLTFKDDGTVSAALPPSWQYSDEASLQAKLETLRYDVAETARVIVQTLMVPSVKVEIIKAK